MKYRNTIIIICLFLSFIYIFTSVSYATSETTYVWSNQSSKLETNEVSASLNTSDDTITNNVTYARIWFCMFNRPKYRIGFI